MSEPHDKRRERNSKLAVVAIFFVAWLFLALSFLSYKPQDLPTKFVYHDLQEIRNLAGLPGAWCAYAVSFCFGVAGYYIVVGFGAALLCYFFCDRVREPYNKVLGFFLTLVAFSGAAAYLFDSSVGPPIGPGGMVGACIKFIFDKFFIRFGAYASLCVLFLAGLVLVAPEKMLRLVFWSSGLGKVVGRVFRPFLERIQRANPQQTAIAIESFRRSGGLYPSLDGRPKQGARPNGSFVSSTSRNAQSAVSSPVLPPRPLTPTFCASAAPAAKKTASEVGVSELVMDSQIPGAAFNDGPAAEIEEVENAALAASDAASDQSVVNEYVYPSIDLLAEGEYYDVDDFSEEIRRRGEELERVCRNYKIELKVVDIQTGPVLTLYEVELQKGLRVKALHNLASDLEIAMRAPHVRIVSPIPGKNTVGIELPNRSRQLVRLREVMEACADEARTMDIPIFLGKDVVGAPMVADLAQLPHLLIAGRTGTGKSVCLNSIIMSIIMTKSPEEVRLLMIDPKMVELSPYKSIPHLMHPVVVDMQKAEALLEWAVEQMEERYRIFARVGVRKISEFNKLTPEMIRRRLRTEDEAEWEAFPKSMPSVVIVADEMADLIMTSGKDVERHIVRLAQKSRAVGIHLVLATQKPTVDVVTGLIKSNLPARIAFGVASRVDSQVVLDVKGAEQLLGNGDMLFLLPGTSQLVRGQGAFVSDREIDDVIDAISVDRPNYVIELADRDGDGEDGDKISELEYDEFYIPAVDFVIGEGRASTSVLQRKFSIGYTRAARIVDVMTQEGIVSPFNPAKPSRPRDVLITMEQWRGKQYAESQNNQSLQEKNATRDAVEEDADVPYYSETERESAKVAQPVVVLSNGEESLASARRYDDPDSYDDDISEENQNSPSGEALQDNKNKDKGWSDEQWNQYINFDSELGK